MLNILILLLAVIVFILTWQVRYDIAHIVTTIIVRNVALSEQILPINLITKEPNLMLSVMKYGVSILGWEGSYIILLFFRRIVSLSFQLIY